MTTLDLRRSAAAAAMLLACGSHAFALNPALDISQYAHHAWRLSEGFSKGAIWSIAQTADGYLWLGTEFGLLRFDGVRTQTWEPPRAERLPSSDVRSLRAARDGRLWIGTFSGLTSWKDDKLSRYPALDGQIIEALLEDREGTIWIVAGTALSTARLCRIQRGDVECYGANGGPGAAVNSIYEDGNGTLWAGAMTGVWRWKPGTPTLYAMAAPPQRTYAMVDSGDGGLLIARRGGITKLKDGRFEPYPLAPDPEFPPGRLFRDRNGALWVGALLDRGLLHVGRRRADRFTSSDGLSGDTISSLFEDREGSIWVATGDGLDRFRDFAVPTVSIRQGLSSGSVTSLLAGKDGSVWLGTSVGLNEWHDDRVARVYRGFPGEVVTSLFKDDHGNVWAGTLNGMGVLTSNGVHRVAAVPPGNLFAIAGDRADNVWISHDTALFHLFREQLVERIPWASFGHKEHALALLPDAVTGGLWLGFRDGGVAFFKDGQLRASYAAAQGLGEGRVHTLYADGSGAVWAATAGGLSRIRDGRVVTLTSQNGLPCSTIHWMLDDDARSVWLYTACGLIRIARSELDAWVTDARQVIHPTVFDSFDGVRSHPFVSGYGPIVARAADGRLWFLAGGASVVDPHHLPINRVPPPIHVEQMIVDGKAYGAASALPLPAGVRDLQIDYTALSLVAPEKNRFRIKLEGRDRDWQDVGNRRQAFYTDLGPRSYRFRVIASNNSGVWNETGATLDFSIAPAYYQTRRFQAVIAVGSIALLWVAYQLRIRQVAHQFNRTLDARVTERTRIARDLHDTLLQSFHGLLLRFQTASYLMADRPAEGRETLDAAIAQAAQAITEGRNAVQGLRASTVERNDLAVAIRTLGDELASHPSAHQPATFSVVVEGESRDLHPIARDEIYKVAAEALRNAHWHAHASRIEVEIRYDKQQFRLRVRDDGRGIDSAVLAGLGVEGHYGLRGMPERATLIGGKVRVWSEAGAGTEVELVIPARAVYATSAARSWWSRVFRSKLRSHVERDGS